MFKVASFYLSLSLPMLYNHLLYLLKALKSVMEEGQRSSTGEGFIQEKEEEEEERKVFGNKCDLIRSVCRLMTDHSPRAAA